MRTGSFVSGLPRISSFAPGSMTMLTPSFISTCTLGPMVRVELRTRTSHSTMCASSEVQVSLRLICPQCR